VSAPAHGMKRAAGTAAPLERLEVAAYRVPTDSPEADGTLEWDGTTIVVVEALAGGARGLGYSYTTRAAATLIHDLLLPALRGIDALAVPAAWTAMERAVRNIGRSGVAGTAIAAVDAALWDLKARLLEVPLLELLGAVRDRIDIYGSGGFTSYPVPRLCQQLADWVEQGIGMVKMKVGRHPSQDLLRIRAVREAIGPEARLFIDANGAYTRKQALQVAEQAALSGVAWFEEPVPSEDLEGLRLLRDRVPPGMDVAAGEYGFTLAELHRLLVAGAVDVLQADATRCGVTGMLKAGALCEAFGVPLSAHTAPALHAHLCCALPAARHVEWFHDHVRIEAMLFDGAVQPVAGALEPGRDRPGLGLTLRRGDAERFAS
jgi:L-alanine-DL-glutamate epimerase-like enolase superfamily enzyme